jgi:hypothetical protein
MTPRPTTLSPEVVDRHARLLLEAIKMSFGEQFTVADDTAQADLRAAVTAAEDGFERAIFLGRRGWTVNERLVALLSKVTMIGKRAWFAAQVEWVMQQGVRVPAKEGDRVSFSEGGRTLTGEVLGVVAMEARAFVKVTGKDAKEKEGDTYTVNAEHILQRFKGNGRLRLVSNRLDDKVPA